MRHYGTMTNSGKRGLIVSKSRYFYPYRLTQGQSDLERPSGVVLFVSSWVDLKICTTRSNPSLSSLFVSSRFNTKTAMICLHASQVQRV